MYILQMGVICRVGVWASDLKSDPKLRFMSGMRWCLGVKRGLVGVIKRVKILKMKGVAPLLGVSVLFVAILRRGCTIFGGSKALICDCDCRL